MSLLQTSRSCLLCCRNAFAPSGQLLATEAFSNAHLLTQQAVQQAAVQVLAHFSHLTSLLSLEQAFPPPTPHLLHPPSSITLLGLPQSFFRYWDPWQSPHWLAPAQAQLRHEFTSLFFFRSYSCDPVLNFYVTVLLVASIPVGRVSISACYGIIFCQNPQSRNQIAMLLAAWQRVLFAHNLLIVMGFMQGWKLFARLATPCTG